MAWLYGIARHQLGRFFRAGRVETLARRRLGMPERPLPLEDYERIEDLVDFATDPQRLPAGEAPASPVPSATPSFGNGSHNEDLSKIVRDGKVGIVVDDGTFRGARNAVTDIANEAGGMVLSSSVDGRSGTFVLSVPARNFDDVMVAIGDLGHVDYEEESGQNVTAEYIDLSAHLAILRERKALLEVLLGQANTVSGILSLSGKVEDVQFEIEQIQGKLRFLDNEIAQSTVRVDLRERSVPEVAGATADDVSKPDLSRAWHVAQQGFLNVISAAIVGLGYLVPLGLIALIGWVTLWLVRRSGRAA